MVFDQWISTETKGLEGLLDGIEICISDLFLRIGLSMVVDNSTNVM